MAAQIAPAAARVLMMDRGELSPELTRDQACGHQTRHQAAALERASGAGTARWATELSAR